MTRANRWLVAAAALSAAALGCSREKVYWGTTENPPVGPKPAVGPDRFVKDLADGDVIAWVDGSSFTKADFDQKMREAAFQIERIPNIKNEQRASMYKSAGRRAIPSFVEDQMAVHEARRRKFFDAEGLKAAILASGEALARTNRTDYAAFAAAWPGGQSRLNRYLEEFVWKKALVKATPPLQQIDDKMAAELRTVVMASNARCSETNQQTVARLKKMRHDIVAGKATFEKLADTVSSKENGEGPGGYWGEFSASDFSDRDFAEKIFALKEGEVSEVLEDDGGFCLIKMLFLKSSPKGEATADLARISLPKELMAEVMSVPVLKAEMQRQQHEQAVDKLMDDLKAKAVVVYPNGTNYWDSTPRSARGGKKQQKRNAGK